MQINYFSTPWCIPYRGRDTVHAIICTMGWSLTPCRGWLIVLSGVEDCISGTNQLILWGVVCVCGEGGVSKLKPHFSAQAETRIICWTPFRHKHTLISWLTLPNITLFTMYMTYLFVNYVNIMCTFHSAHSWCQQYHEYIPHKSTQLVYIYMVLCWYCWNWNRTI